MDVHIKELDYIGYIVSNEGMKILMKRKIFLSILCIVLIVLLGCSRVKSISYESIQEKEVLCKEVRDALEQELGKDKISLYTYSNNGVHEYLLHYVCNYGKNYYQTLHLKPYQKKNVLILELTVNQAVNDSNVTDELTAYFSLKKEPDEIKVYLDGKLTDLDDKIEVEQIRKDK